MADEVKIWNNVLATAMAIPGVKVNRREFLTHTLLPYCENENLKAIINGDKPVSFLPLGVIDLLADKCISKHITLVTAASAVAGIPGGLAMLAGIPADMAQYYYHVFVLSQKMAYLYGFPDLVDENGELSEDAQNQLTLFTGIMLGVAIANEAIQELAKRFAGQVVKRLPKYALTKTVIYPMVKQVVKWIGIKLTKDSFAKGLGKTIPFLGAGISGALTYFTFKPGAERLKKSLHDSALIMQRPKQATVVEEAEIVEE